MLETAEKEVDTNIGVGDTSRTPQPPQAKRCVVPNPSPLGSAASTSPGFLGSVFLAVLSHLPQSLL